jgi:hypothetical protein
MDVAENPAYTYRRLLDMSRTIEQERQYNIRIVIYPRKSVISADNFSSLLQLSPCCQFLIFCYKRYIFNEVGSLIVFVFQFSFLSSVFFFYFSPECF